MDVTNIATLSDYLSEQLPTTASIEDIVNHSLKKAASVVDFIYAHPAISLAIFQNSQSEIDAFSRQIITLAVFGKLNVFNDHFLQHIIAAHIVTHYLQRQKQDTAHALRRSLILFIKQNQLQIWRQVISLRKVLFSQSSIRLINSAKVTPLQNLSLTASIFSHCRQKHSALSLLRFIAQNAPAIFRAYLYPIASLVAQPLPGARVFFKAHPATVIDIQRDHILLFSPSREESAPFQWVNKAKIYAPTTHYMALDEFLGHYNQCEQERKTKGSVPFFPISYAIQHPPASLLGIIDELKQPDVNIPKLCKKVEVAPTFSRFLLSTASQDNRLRLPVSSVKQAILTYGLERVGDMLVQFALMERLTQHKYPLLNMSKQFTLLACAIASQLASITSSKFSPQSAALVTTFLCAPLFTLPGLKIALFLPVNNKDYFQIHKTFKIKNTVQWNTIAGELASNWHQGATWRALIHHSGKHHLEVPASLRKEHAIVQLAFGLAREYLFPLKQRDHATDIARNTLLKSINLTQNDVKLIMNRVNEYLYCPLNLHS